VHLGVVCSQSMSTSQPLVAQSSSNEEVPETLWTQLTQQRLKGWQPVLPAKVVIAGYGIGGFGFVAVGIALLLMSWQVEEHILPYTNVNLDENGVGVLELTVPRDMEAPIWVYYELEHFHQNHRRYVKSRDDRQLQAATPVHSHEDKLSSCKPAVMGEQGRPLYPCGLVARSVFNDSFALVSRGPNEGDAWKGLEVDSAARTIAWAADVDSDKFANYNPEQKTAGKPNQVQLDMWMTRRFPPSSCIQSEVSDVKRYSPLYVGTRVEAGVNVADCSGYGTKDVSCNFVDSHGKNVECAAPAYKKVAVADWGVTSGHFMAWMRVAGLPKFRKLWGKVDGSLRAGTKLKVHVASNFPVTGFGGQKALVISTSSPLGGRNDFLGIGYMLVGVACLGSGTWNLWKHMGD